MYERGKKTSGSIRERKREVSNRRRSVGSIMSGVWMTDCPQKHQESRSKLFKADSKVL